jgi:hypothetical protein
MKTDQQVELYDGALLDALRCYAALRDALCRYLVALDAVERAADRGGWLDAQIERDAALHDLYAAARRDDACDPPCEPWTRPTLDTAPL